MAVWNTDSVGIREGFAFWQDAVCQAVLSVATEQEGGEAFQARITSRASSTSRFAAFEAGSHAIVRSKRHIASLSDGGYLVSLQLRGLAHIEQGDDRFILSPDEIAIIDGERPFRVRFPDQVERLVAVVPRRLLESRAPWIKSNGTCRIWGDAPALQLTRLHLHHLACSRPELESRDADLLTENLCNLLAVSTSPNRDRRRTSADLTLEKILLAARQNLADPGLSPAMVGALCGVSIRTLHDRFRMLGETWSRWVLLERLDACRTSLEDSRQDQCSVSEIAYRWGFSDLSHFNKRFRDRYGMPPGAFRKGRIARRQA